MSNQQFLQGRYFEEYKVGDFLTSTSRTIVEGDLTTFAALSGDFSGIHMDSEMAEKGPFKQRVAHGLLVMSIASGLLVKLGFLEGTLMAFREMTWKFSLPVFIGDTLCAEAKVVETRTMPRLGGGLVGFEVGVLNQSDKQVQSGRWSLLISSRKKLKLN